jgi:hypothetical protein
MMPSPKMVVTAPGDHRTISRTSPRLTRASARQNQVDTGISSQTIASSTGNPNDASFCSQALLISHVESQITSMSTSQAAVIASPSGNESGTVPYSKELATASMQEEQHSDLPPSQANAVSVASEDNTIVLTQSAPLFDQFHAFPKLPVELRLAIWELTLPKSRRVTVNQQKIRTRSDKKPVLLDVNQESRTLTLKRYVEVYANRNHWHIARGLPPKWPVQFIDPSNDVLVLYSDDLRGGISYAARYKGPRKELQKWMKSAPKIRKDIRKVVVIGEMLCYHETFLNQKLDNKMKAILAGFEPLEEVVFEVQSPRSFYASLMSDLPSTDQLTRRFFGSWSKKPKVEWVVA